MKIIPVQATKSYQVHVGSNLLSQTGDLLQQISKANTVAIISDTHVWPLYGKTVYQSLAEKGFQVLKYVFPAGEESKSGQTYLSILDFLAINHVTRTDCIVALGGGVVGDMAGFVAATYLRGIDYVHIPTTLLAAVDSSVGGKTAIDLPAGKNLAGAFYQPSLVVCDITTFDTLPDPVFRDGCSEVIKYGVLYDRELFDHLKNQTADFDRINTITRCIQLKRDVVQQDEFDVGQRQKLNLGHTVGHGIEAVSNFKISHGMAVAAGMAIIARAAAAAGLCEKETAKEIQQVLLSFSLPIHTDFTVEEIIASALSDKKRAGNNINLIIPRDIGDCIILPTPVDQLKSFISEGM